MPGFNTDNQSLGNSPNTRQRDWRAKTIFDAKTGTAIVYLTKSHKFMQIVWTGKAPITTQEEKKQIGLAIAAAMEEEEKKIRDRGGSVRDGTSLTAEEKLHAGEEFLRARDVFPKYTYNHGRLALFGRTGVKVSRKTLGRWVKHAEEKKSNPDLPPLSSGGRAPHIDAESMDWLKNAWVDESTKTRVLAATNRVKELIIQAIERTAKNRNVYVSNPGEIATARFVTAVMKRLGGKKARVTQLTTQKRLDAQASPRSQFSFAVAVEVATIRVPFFDDFGEIAGYRDVECQLIINFDSTGVRFDRQDRLMTFYTTDELDAITNRKTKNNYETGRGFKVLTICNAAGTVGKTVIGVKCKKLSPDAFIVHDFIDVTVVITKSGSFNSSKFEWYVKEIVMKFVEEQRRSINVDT